MIFFVRECEEPPCPPPGLCLHLLLCSGSEANLDLIWGHWSENRSLTAGLGFPSSYLFSETCPKAVLARQPSVGSRLELDLLHN